MRTTNRARRIRLIGEAIVKLLSRSVAALQTIHKVRLTLLLPAVKVHLGLGQIGIRTGTD